MTKGEKESTVLTMESAALGDSSQAKPLRALRCSNCQLKHIRCDGAQPGQQNFSSGRGPCGRMLTCSFIFFSTGGI